MRSFLKTIVGGAAALLALYTVGRTAYLAGKEAAREEERLRTLRASVDENSASEEGTPETIEREASTTPEAAEPVRKPSKLSMLLGLRRVLGRKSSVVGKLFRHPEAHKIEAFVERDGLHIRVRERPNMATL